MTKLLLTSVFQPYGVNDQYGHSLCTMELLNNQVTREQGIHSPRSNNPSFALYFLAENVKVQTRVLDFPTWRDFTREIANERYTHVGISFIVPNVLKVKRMAQYIRKHSPGTRIILGGHGTSIPSLREMMDFDEVCRGEGVEWLRQYFGEDPSESIVHPVLQSAVRQRIYGAPIFDKSGILVPGVGCTNSCRFCATSHKFERRYIPFLDTGKEVFDVCERSERKLGVSDFGVLDENFLKTPRRAKQFLAEMESHKRAYTFGLFSSAETVARMGVDFLVRMGVTLLWIGVESKWNVFEKTRGVDLASLIKDLQNHGISVLSSSILFLEHHDKFTINEDIDWAIGLESDLHQFMLFGPLPGTRLYRDYEKEGKLLEGIPWPKKHGQDEIWFRHPHFTLAETSSYLKEAFIKKYQTHGPGVLNLAFTAIRGYLTLSREAKAREEAGLVWDLDSLKYIRSPHPHPDEFMRLRLASMRRNALKYRPLLSTTLRYAPNAESAEKARTVIRLFDRVFGRPTIRERVKKTAVRICATVETVRLRRSNGVLIRQPGVHRCTYLDRTDARTHETRRVKAQAV